MIYVYPKQSYFKAIILKKTLFFYKIRLCVSLYKYKINDLFTSIITQFYLFVIKKGRKDNKST